MKVAVSGASGFLGNHVVPHLLARGHEVLALGRGGTGDLAALAQDGSITQEGPLPDLLAGCEALVHLAARTVDETTVRFADFVEPNVLLTERVIDAGVAAGVRRFVLASSRLVYPGTLQGPAREDCPLLPDTFYGLSKRVAEQVLEIRTGEVPDASGVALRIAQVVGPGDGDRGALNAFIRQAAGGGPITVAGEGAGVRDVVDVRDVTAAVAAAVEAEAVPRAVNIGGGSGRSIRDMARTVAMAFGLDPDADVMHTSVDREDRSHYSLDCSLAHETLGWHAQHTLTDTVQFKLSAQG